MVNSSDSRGTDQRRTPPAIELLTVLEAPVLCGRIGDRALCRQVGELLIAEAAASNGIGVSIRGGWHGPVDLVERREPPWPRLMALMVGAARDAVHVIATARGRSLAPFRLAAEGWGVVLGAGGSADWHDHGEAHWSCVWYADRGDDPPPTDPRAGRLVFQDLRVHADASTPLLELAPETGRIVVFPGWLPHAVIPYAGRRPRVSVSCNVRVEPAVGERLVRQVTAPGSTT